MDINEIKTYLDSNKDSDEVKNFLGSFYTPDRLNPYLETETGKKILQPKLDTHFNKALETWKNNNLNSIVEQEVNKRNPPQTEEQKRLAKLEKDLEDQKRENVRAGLKAKALDKLTELKLPLKLVDLVIGNDEAGTLENIKTINDNYEAEIAKRVDEKFKENGRRKPGEKKETGDVTSGMNKLIRQSAGIKTN